MTDVSGIRNHVQMTDLVGTSGQPTREEFAQIAAAGYGTVINLALPTSENAIADEGAIVSALGMQYIHIPVPFDAPAANHLKSFVGIMCALDAQKVWVHCVVNFRVSAFMYHYLRLEKGYADEAAKNAIFRRWEPKMEPVWKRFVAIGRADLE